MAKGRSTKRASAGAGLIWLPALNVVLKKAQRYLARKVSIDSGEVFENKRVYQGGPYPDMPKGDYRHIRVKMHGQKGRKYIGRIWWKPGKLGTISEE